MPDASTAPNQALGPAASGHPRSRRLVIFLGGLAGLSLAVVAETGWVMFGRNFHVVIPGRVYRCAQESGTALEQTVRAWDIRTVVNLRGCGATLPWYTEECRATHGLNVSQEDVSFSASRLPAVQEVRQLLRVLDHSEYPILLHCRQGADRTGLAAVMVLLLQTDTDLETARRHLGLRFGHLAVERAAHLDRFFAMYADWLKVQGRSHSPAVFRAWAEHDYCPAECRCTLEPLEVPARIPRGTPVPIRVRATNTSLEAWRLRPENNAGVHVAFTLRDAQDRGVSSGRSGLFDAVVNPGESIDLTLVLPAVKQAGRYRFLADMVDEQHCWFYQAGSEPLERELEVQ
jgi:hypothetical protein